MEQRDLLGRMKFLPYEEVLGGKIERAMFATIRGPLGDEVVVYGMNTKIIHSPTHADRYGFIALVRERTRKRVEYVE